MNILILGRSTKFVSLMQELYPASIIEVIPWRSLSCTTPKKKKYQFILVCGFNYSVISSNFDDFFQANVNDPMSFLRKHSGGGGKIIYIETDSSNKKTTLSRYKFIKRFLGVELVTNFHNVKVISFPTILGADGRMDIYAGFFSKIIFNFLLALGVVKVIDRKSLRSRVVSELEECLSSGNSYEKYSGLFIRVPRPLLIDRVLRLFYG